MPKYLKRRTRLNQYLSSKKSRAASLFRTVVLAASTAGIVGCASSPDVWDKTVCNDTCEIDQISATVDNPVPEIYPTSYSGPPVTADTLTSGEFENFRDIPLEEVFRIALENSTVIRELGGVVLINPDTVKTRFSSALAESDPRFGMEAALSAFDAQFTASAMLSDNDRLFNNSFFAGGTSAFVQDLHEYDVGLTKRSATGSQISLRNRTVYDANNAPANNFPSYWESIIEAEVRQPLLQGAGLEFNRIAGPGSVPGIYNGLLIAKVNTDIDYHEFQLAVRDFLSNVENAYWDLYFGYRLLDAQKKGMEEALRVWNIKKATAGVGIDKAPEEALARQQYFEFKSDVEDSLSGRLIQGTQTRNGSGGGTLHGQGGVLAAERRLRLLIGLPAADGNLLRPSDEPPLAEVQYDWATISQEALTQRIELRKQQLVVKKNEMELLAAENFLNPRLDAVARYRVRGLGDDLFSGGFNRGDTPASSFGNMMTGDHQEYMLGFELEVPLGYRRGHAAVDNAEFRVARARAIFKEQQRDVISNLSGAVAEAVRAHRSITNAMNQYLAAKEYLDALERRQREGLNDPVDLILDAQTRVVDAEIRLFRTRSEYAVALKNVQFEKGTLLTYANFQMVTYDQEPAPAELEQIDSMPLPVDEDVTSTFKSAPVSTDGVKQSAIIQTSATEGSPATIVTAEYQDASATIAPAAEEQVVSMSLESSPGQETSTAEAERARQTVPQAPRQSFISRLTNWK
ncbi:TolC family protein [Thalassoglobus sp. JC818]|uniref:TolC family protein n=1 Tax=Thalassoglobus sp. JC818 TaxID=3232136 RepID=UPI003457CF7E